MLPCRKCAYLLGDGDAVPERCPNCGTMTRAPAPEALPPVALGTVWRHAAGEVAVPEDRSQASSREPEDLPAPVASSRPFTLPALTRRIPVPAATAARNELENSAELDLPMLSRPAPSDTVVASPRPSGSTRPDDLDLDLDDLHSEGAGEPADASPLPRGSAPAPRILARERLRGPARRPLPVPMVTPRSAPADPSAGLQIALVLLTGALLGLGWFYFSRGLGAPELAGAGELSAGTWPEGYLKTQAQRLDVDRASEYLVALAEAEAVGDPLGRAEAALCMHVRYGPDLVRRSAAGVWRRQAASGDPRAQRVEGLAALAEGRIEAAEQLLADGDDARTHLYRALVAQQREAVEVAAREAAQALALRSNDTAAALVAATATLAARWDAPLTGLQAALETHPGHPLYQQALLRAQIDRGRLAEARVLVMQLGPVVGASEAHHARVQMLKAELAAAAGEYQLAQLEADEAGQLAPQHLPIQLARARLLLAIGEQGRAQQEITPLTRGPTADPEALALQAELALRAGNESMATRAIDRLADSPPRWRGRVALLRGRVHVLRGRNDEAAAAFITALNEAPGEVDAAIALAELRVRTGASNPLRSLIQAEALLRASPPASHRRDLRALTLTRANLLLETGRKDQALAVLDAALATDPDDNAAQLRRGVLAIEQGRSAAGRADLMAVLQRTGGYPGLVGPLGRLYLRDGDLTGLAGLIQPHPSEQLPDDVALMRGLLRLAQGDRDAADQDIDQVLQRSPGSWEAHLAKARVLHERDRIPEALAEIRLAKPRSPDAEVELWTGKIAERSGKPLEAAAAFRRARQLDPSLLEAAFLHGRSLLAQGLAREAVTELQTVTRVTDAFPAAHLALGLALREREQLPEALQSFVRAAGSDANPEAHYWAGRTAAELNRFEEAADQLGRSVALASPGAPWLADAQLWLGRTQHRRDRRAEARAAFTAYLELAGPRAPARAEAQRLLRER